MTNLSAVTSKLWRGLPVGTSLAEEAWRLRHRAILTLVWIQGACLGAFALYQGFPISHSGLEATAVVSVPLLIELIGVRNRTVRSTASSIGLITASAVLTHLSGGMIEAHFHFFVMLAVIAFYQTWATFLASILYVLIHHGAMGAIAPESVYNHADAIANPWKWALIHAAFVSGACAVYVVAWRMNELTQAAVAESEERFRRLAEHSPVGIYQITTAPQAGVYLNPSALDMLEVDDVAEVERIGLNRFFPEASRATIEAERQKRATGAASSYEVDIVGRRGTRRTVLLSGAPMLDQEGRISAVVGTVTDITERKRLEEALRHQAFHDPLTRLANRARFTDRLEHAFQRAERNQAQVSVLFLDLDDFKIVNDRFGHSVGDVILVEVARRIEQCLRPGDTAARFGGDEFAILLEEVSDVEEAQDIADRVLVAVSAPIAWNDNELRVNASIGIAFGTESHAGRERIDADSILRSADVAMYVAKSGGKGRSEVFEDAMRASMIDRLELLADLAQAVAKEQLVVHYQPTLNLKTEEIMGFEALVRWEHPSRGLLPPSEFISLAEESDLINSIGEWILRTACRDMQRWRRTDPNRAALTMSVNVSARQIQQDGFAGQVRAILEDAEMDPQKLVLEVTESIMLHDVQTSVRRLQELKALGIRLAIDDFGTGYSSIAYLSQFPFDILKIDKSFIDSAGDPNDEQQLMPAIIDLGRMLNMQTVAEGIERSEQLARLRLLTCDLGQGFLWAKPLPAEDIEELLSRSDEDRGAA